MENRQGGFAGQVLLVGQGRDANRGPITRTREMGAREVYRSTMMRMTIHLVAAFVSVGAVSPHRADNTGGRLDSLTFEAVPTIFMEKDDG